MCFKNGKITPILGPFRAKTAQLWRPVSRQRDNIFRFGKKFLAPHNQEMKICENEKKLRPSPYRLKFSIRNLDT